MSNELKEMSFETYNAIDLMLREEDDDYCAVYSSEEIAAACGVSVEAVEEIAFSIRMDAYWCD